MSTSQLFGVNNSGCVFSLSTDQSSWQEIPNVRIKFKQLASHESIIWALGEDHQVYVYVYGTSAPIRVCEESYENQRWYPIEGFASNLLPTDRNNFSSEDGISDRTLASIELPTESWIWEGPWHLDNMFEEEVLNEEAWTYSLDFPWSYTAGIRWNSHVRRRKWVRYRRYAALDAWNDVTPLHHDYTLESFLDISVGGGEVPGVDADELMVWAVTALNRDSHEEEFQGVPQSQQTKVMVREGVCGICPEGVSWTYVPTPVDQDVISVSVGRSGRVWAVTWDGVTLVRTGISKNNLTGTDWKVVESPTDGCLQHIAVGVNVVWALTRDNKVWFRGESARDQGPSSKSIINQPEQSEDFVYLNNDLDTPWQLVEGNLEMISVGPYDHVWGVTAEDHSPVVGTGITPQEMTGSTWQPIAIPLVSELLPKPSPTLCSAPSQTSGPGLESSDKKGLESSEKQGLESSESEKPGLESSEKQIIDSLSSTDSCSSPDAFKSSSLRMIKESDEECSNAVLSDSNETNLKVKHQIDHLKVCSICYEGYNDGEYRPLVLPCGHTLCKECINKISSGFNISVVQCPICRTNHTVNRNNLPTNYVVLDLVRATGNIVQQNESYMPMLSECKNQDPKSEENNHEYEKEKEDTKSNSGKSSGMSKTTKNILIGAGVGLGAVATGVGAVLAAPVVLTGLGFTSAGIAAGSVAASMMSAAAVAEGGVVAGSVVAVLQSAGAAGLSAGAAAGVGVAGATVGAAAGTGIALGIGSTSQDETANADTQSDMKKEQVLKKKTVKPRASYYWLKTPINWS